MNYSSEIRYALSQAWHIDAAENSFKRWLELLHQESWKMSDESLLRLIALFGSSWYFTRFCFYRGNNIIPLFDKDRQSLAVVQSRLDEFTTAFPESSLDVAIEQLRLNKNELMLSVLLLHLANIIDQEQAEALLTQLAEKVLISIYRLFDIEQPGAVQCAILAMGRFAGNEMNYGSDLDLIFIEKILSSGHEAVTLNKIRKMLRYIATNDPSGTLYEIDTRLRPHGSSGVLVTPLDSFIHFHQTEREAWERQMMTRCRVIVGDSALAKQIINAININIYKHHEKSYLAREIVTTRLLVQQELAGGSDKIDLKRGYGGIMDVDFLTHFLQLAYGTENPQLRITSTRAILKASSKLGVINASTAAMLLSAYDFYKKSESALRVFDMKSISSVNKDTKSLLPLARASGFIETEPEKSVADYLAKLMDYREQVRQTFELIMHAAI